jgi:putative tryptophan/tyrosine transport system substrate-binding protein
VRNGVQVQAAARGLGRALVVLNATNEREIDQVFKSLVRQQIGALLVDADTLFLSRRHQLVALAAHYSVPAIYDLRDYVADGGLMSYGASLTDAYRRVGTYVGRILKGVPVSDLPVEQAASSS